MLPAGPARVSHPFGATRYYRHGWHSWSLAHWADLSGPPHVAAILQPGAQGDAAANLAGNVHGGSWVGAVEGPEGNALVLGALGIDARVTGDERELRGRSAGDPSPWFVGYGNAEDTLEAYARELGRRLGSVARDPGRVWCSWYSHYTGVTEAIVDETLAGIDGLAFDVVQIDDGWQVEIGDWQVNDDFPSGMAAVAGRIAAAGYRPGLWLAPFVAHERSQMYAEHPGWFLPGAAGENWGGPYYGFDMTHPEARDHVATLIRTAVDWGYTYLKLDFLFAAALGGEQPYRSGIELIREVAGDEVYLLACGSPIVPSIGVFNGMRVGPDVAPWWEDDANTRLVRDYSYPSTRSAVSTSHARLWLRSAIAVDPDVAYFRTRYNLLAPGYRRLLQDLCLVAGFRATSDPPGWLLPEERAELAAFLTAPGEVERLDRYRFRVDGRVVDFGPASLDHPAPG